ncbi:MAG: long-chain fatty acid--CoA ligase [Desulfurellaceae bacterium]|nr:long-chain fatty acid--CoA ligase [Desulfurellaceae bacterium]
MGDTSLTSMILDRAARYGSRRVFLRKRGSSWEDISWQQFGDQIVRAARGLAALGFQPGDRLAILADNRPEWPLLDLACLYLGGVDVPLYLTSPPDDLAYILNDAGASVLAVAGDDQRQKIAQIASEVPSLGQVIHLDTDSAPDAGLPNRLTALSLTDLLASGEHSSGPAQPVPDPGLATIIYTSGTTGRPKGVMLSHTNMLANAEDATAVLPLNEEDLLLSFLPLSHGFERTGGFYTSLRAGGTIAYGGGIASLTDDLSAVRPTILCCVPRVLERVYQHMLGERESASFVKQKILSWALEVGRAVGRVRTADVGTAALPLPLSLQHGLADRLVFRALRSALGGRIRFLVSGGAPLNADLACFFYGAGISVYEGYGLTEAGPVVACNTPDRNRVGSVGTPLPQVSVRIADDGEVCVRGPNVMAGYYNRPEDTAAALDAEGWLHTGDIGAIDAQGFLSITDRKKDLLITSQGENVAPQPIEGRFRQEPLIEEACLIGDQRPYLAVLLVPDREFVEITAGTHGVSGAWPAVLDHPTIRALFQQCFETVSSSLPRHAQPRKFALLAEPFSQDSNELTPTLKVKRRTVLQTRQAEIDGLYLDQ